ncbi:MULTISPECIES: hypothetical protein [unclassified Pseudomonas]|jgi:hypothetical protein|uniref:hypothetical protein n=1 Tax=unclassified Pseudomonas TaxID=196821 RepID=UPI00382B7667
MTSGRSVTKLFVSCAQGSPWSRIRHFDGDGPALDAFLLLGDEVRAVFSHEYRDRLNQVRYEDMSNSTLLYSTSHTYWSRWLA